MQNTETQNQNETAETGAEYLRRLAGDIREAGQTATAFDIEAAADKIEQQAREIEALAQQSDQHQKAAREIAETAAARQQDDDRLAAALMAVMGDRIEALVSDELETFRRDFDVSDYQSDIEYMLSDQIGEAIDDRLPEPETDDDRQEAVESIVRDILAGATVTIDI